MFTTLFTSITIISVLIIIYVLDRRFSLLRDTSTAKVRPYSYSRVQLAFWFIIILASYSYIGISTLQLPDANETVLLLLGLTSSTMCFSKMIDASDNKDNRHQNNDSQGLFLDILTNDGGVSMLRLQALVFNVLFGAYFVYVSISTKTLPIISLANLGLIGISSGSYVFNKTLENKQ